MRSGIVDHETARQRDTLAPWTGHYSRTAYAGWRPDAWPSVIDHVGICLSAGFTSNKLPTVFWHEFARLLSDCDVTQLCLIGGPQERAEAHLLARLLGGSVDVLIGGADIEAFHARLGQCDVVVGADSGTLHLASMVVPVLGVFTSSPWWRYAPFGRHNRVVFAEVDCSPCIQFSRDAYNGCLTRECAALIAPRDLFAALWDDDDVIQNAMSPGVSFVAGPSHWQGT
jgi:ADP-heptose:LPS heptosyltransferase